MACQCHFEAPAERRAVDCGHDWLWAVFDLEEHFIEAGRLRRLVEFGDVGTGNERAASAGQNDRPDLGIRNCLLRTLQYATADGGTEGVYRRAVDGDNSDDIVTFEGYNVAHSSVPFRRPSSRRPVQIRIGFMICFSPPCAAIATVRKVALGNFEISRGSI